MESTTKDLIRQGTLMIKGYQNRFENFEVGQAPLPTVLIKSNIMGVRMDSEQSHFYCL